MAKEKPKKSIDEILKSNAEIKLDLACGGSKHPGYVGMDIFPYPGVDIVHDATVFPWPLPDESITHIIAAHFLEHVPATGVDPRLRGLIDLLLKKKLISKKEAMESFGDHNVFSNFIRIFDEAWRVLKPGGQFALAVPYYSSIGFAQDPTHVKMICEATLCYFDPEHESHLWNFYKPKPWKIEMQTFQSTGNLEAIISKRDIRPYEQAIQDSRKED